MHFTKIHTTGSDFLLTSEKTDVPYAVKLLDRRLGIGADGFIFVEGTQEAKIRLFSPNGKEIKASLTAVIAAAKFIYDSDSRIRKSLITLGEKTFSARLSLLSGRVLCIWIDLPKIKPHPMEQLKYYHGIRGEVLRSFIARPRLSLYRLCGEHAVFLLESPVAVRTLALSDVCKKLSDVLFYGENLELHFAAISGEGSLVMRSWKCGDGEICSSGEGAVLSAYAALESELLLSQRIIVKTLGGSYCVELDGQNASLCAKCETVFCGEAV